MKNKLNGIEYEPILSPEKRIACFIKALADAKRDFKGIERTTYAINIAQGFVEAWFADELAIIKQSKKPKKS